MSTQLPIGIFARECPLDAALGVVASSFPRRHLGGEGGGLLGSTTRRTLAGSAALIGQALGRSADSPCARRKAALTRPDAMYILVDTLRRGRRCQEPQSSPCSSGAIASPYAYRPRWRVLRISPSASPWRSRSRMMGCSLSALVGQG